MRDPVATLVHGAPAGAVSHVWVGGRCLYDEGSYTTLDIDAVGGRAERWRDIAH